MSKSLKKLGRATALAATATAAVLMLAAAPAQASGDAGTQGCPAPGCWEWIL